MIMGAENTTATLTTQHACVIISHTLEFFWYVLHLKVVLIVVTVVIVVTENSSTQEFTSRGRSTLNI